MDTINKNYLKKHTLGTGYSYLQVDVCCTVQWDPVHGSAEEHMWNIQTHDLIWSETEEIWPCAETSLSERERQAVYACIEESISCNCVWVKLLYDCCLFITDVSVKHYSVYIVYYVVLLLFVCALW